MALTAAEEAELAQLDSEIAAFDTQPAQPIAEPQAVEPEPTGLETAAKTIFPASTAQAQIPESEELRDAKIEIETIETRQGANVGSVEEARADRDRVKELRRTVSRLETGPQLMAAISDTPIIGNFLSRLFSGAVEGVSAEEGKGVEEFLKTMQDPEAGIFKGGRKASNKFFDEKIQGTESKVLKGTLTGLKFLTEAAISVPEDPGAILGTGVKVASKVPKVLGVLESGVKGLTKAPGAATAGLSSQLTGVSGEALQEVGLGFGKKAKALKAASQESGAAFNIGEDLVEKINNFDELIPEAKQVKEALKNMPDIPTKRVIKTLENSLVKNAVTDAATNSNAAIQRAIDNLKKAGETLTATNFRKLRIQFDEGIEFGKPGFDAVENSFSRARKSMAQDLRRAAKKSGNTAFQGTMKTFSKKMEAISKLSKKLGKTRASQADRAETFVNTLFGKSKTARQGLVKDFDEIFGAGFFDEIKTAKLSAELGSKGVPTLLPKPGGSRQIGAIGAGVVGGAVAPIVLPAVAALSSPKVASKLIALFDVIGEGTFKTSKGLAKLSVKDEVIASEAFNAIIKALPKSETEKIAGLMDKRESATNARNKQNIDKRINSILSKGL